MEKTDPLHLAPEALNPELAYQWFRVSTFVGESDESIVWRARGWTAVQRAEMPGEPSNSDEFVQRHEMRLFARPKAEVEAATLAAVEAAIAAYRVLDEATKLRPWGAPLPPASRTPDIVVGYARQTKPLRWFEEHPRGGLLIIHEDAFNKRIARFAASLLTALQYRLAPWRIVYMPRGETEMADYMHMPYGDWAWAKIDLVRERALPSFVKTIVRCRYVIQINCPNWRGLIKKR